MFSEQIAPLVHIPNRYERSCTENNVLSGRGLARRPLSARRVHMYQNDLTRCAVYTQYVILRRPKCMPVSTWTNGYREHFTVLVIWTLVYREHVPRTFCRGCVPRTYMNGPIVPCLCTHDCCSCVNANELFCFVLENSPNTNFLICPLKWFQGGLRLFLMWEWWTFWKTDVMKIHSNLPIL